MSDSDGEKPVRPGETFDPSVYGHPEAGDVVVSVDHGADSELQRLLSTRHITMIALGSSIGMGLWLGSGTSLASGGPAGIFIGCKQRSSAQPAKGKSRADGEFRHPEWFDDLVCRTFSR